MRGGRMAEQPQPVTVWTIAGGILIALLVWRGFEVWQYNREMRALNAQIEDMAAPLTRTAREIDRQARRPTRAPRRTPTAIDTRPLQDGERCIDGQRFRRLSN